MCTTHNPQAAVLTDRKPVVWNVSASAISIYVHVATVPKNISHL